MLAKKHSLEFKTRLMERNFTLVAAVYKDAMKKLNVSCVHVWLAEDETVIVANIEHNATRDILQWFCGIKDKHQCSSVCEVAVGDGEQDYANFVSGFKENQIGSLARAVITNPIHKCLPKIPIVVHPTCNKFTSAMACQRCMKYTSSQLLDL